MGSRFDSFQSIKPVKEAGRVNIRVLAGEKENEIFGFDARTALRSRPYPKKKNSFARHPASIQ